LTLLSFVRCSYVPGFDTHGLPLELKALSALKKPASALTPPEIRSAARKEAEKGIELQTGEFTSFAVMGDWENPYRTMDWSYEKRQLGVVKDMVGKGTVFFTFSLSFVSPSSYRLTPIAACDYRTDCFTQPSNAVFSIFENCTRRSRTRIQRRSRFAFRLRRFPSLIPRRRAENCFRSYETRLGERKDQFSSLDYDSLDFT
jgi:isoleucyl-tRNA synthetase